jgi:hypothetical protein
MSCICNSPVRPEFKDSYKDLLDKPQINGVTLSGNLTAADLGIKAGAQFKIVAQLPVTDIEEATIYLVPVQVGQTDNIYQEWIYINNKWEKIGEPINIQGAEQQIFFVDRTIWLRESISYNLLNLQGLNAVSNNYTFRDNAIYKLFLNSDNGIFNTLAIPALSTAASFVAFRNIPLSGEGGIDIATDGASVLIADEIIIANGLVFIGGYDSLSQAFFPGLTE